MGEQEQVNIILSKKAYRFGWKDLILNLGFSGIMIASIVVFIGIIRPEDIADWIIRIFVTIAPLLIFGNRVLKELFYSRDFITIENSEVKYRSTPLLMTGFRTKKGSISIKEIRRYGISRIPRKMSLDMWRKHKNKAMIVVQLRSGKEFFIGEFLANEDLAEVSLHIRHIYPKARFTTNLAEEFPELSKKAKQLEKSKKIQQIEELDEEPEGVGFRKR